MAESFPTLSLSRRLLALFCAVMVFALGLFSASPALHRQLYHATHGPADDGCAVTLFANGVSAPVPLQAPPPPVSDWERVSFPRSPELCLELPTYRLRPERGPPAIEVA